MVEVRRVAVVRGVVQGVGFRMNARATALGLGVSGSARNLADGSVEVQMQGAAEAVDALVAWLRRGPRFASVDSVQVTEVPLEPESSSGTSFEVR